MHAHQNRLAVWHKAGLVALLAALIAGGIWFHQTQGQLIRQQVAEHLTSIARLKADQIAGWHRDQMEKAGDLQHHPYLVPDLLRFLTQPNSSETQTLIQRLRSQQTQHHYANILIVDALGQVRISLNDHKEAYGAYKGALSEAFGRRRPVFIDLHNESALLTPHISVVVPVLTDDTLNPQPLGGIVLINDATQFLFPLIQSWPIPSQTAETLLVRRDGDEVLFLNPLRHQTDTALKLRIPLTRSEVPAVKAVLGHQGVLLGMDYRGVEVVSVTMPIAASPWFMVAKMDVSEAFAEWHWRSASILALAVILIGMALLLFVVVWQRNKKAHYRSLYAAQASLNVSLQRHSVTLQAIGDAVIATDALGKVELLNPVAEKLTGWNLAEAQGKPLEVIFPIVNEYTGVTVENPVDRVLREGVVVGLANHTLLIDRNGNRTPIADSGAPIFDEQGQISGVVLVFRDQTEERERQAQFRAIVEGAPDAIFVRRGDNFAYLNACACRMFGAGAKETLLGTPVIERFAVVAREHIRERMRILDEKRTALPIQEQRWLRMDGSEIPVEVAAVPIIYEGKASSLVFARDITERKQAEAERERMLAAIEQSGEMIVITDADGAIQYVNPAFEQTTGYRRDQAIGQNPRILKSGQQDPAFYQSLWQTITSGKTWVGRLVNKRQDGTVFTEEATISPVHDVSGRIVSYVAVKRNITEHLRLTAQFQQAQKMESVGRLAGGVAHDYNNMLSVILGQAEIAMESVSTDDPLKNNLKEIIDAAQRSASITRQLLAFARKQTIAPEVIDLNAAVERMLKMLRRLIGEEIDLAWLPHDGLWSVKMDPSQLDQVLVNLCINARDAITGVGKITIETDNVTIDEAYCRDHLGFSRGEFIRLAISDDGCGMDPETLANIFEPFYSTKEISQGTGLGLATVYGIVKQNEGFINVYSEPGKGSTFKIYLPCFASVMEEKKALPIQEIPAGSGETVLLVEDEVAIMKMIHTMLERSGYRVLCAETPLKAEQIAEQRNGKIDLLLTDVVMPEMNGRELADRLRSRYPGLKTLFMSGYTANVIAHRGVLDKGVHFIHKPFSKRALAVKVREVLEG